MKRTPLYEKHVASGARIIDFGGWALPFHYTGVVEEHRATRRQAGLFDVCHMGEIDVEGRDAFTLLQLALTRDLTGLAPGRMKLSLMVNERGGALDDLTVYGLAGERFRLVTNAVNRDKVLGQLEGIRRKEGLGGCSILDVSDGMAKLDLQGPRAETLLQRLVPQSLAPLRFYHAMETSVGAVPALISRSGYTGEDGFEIYGSAAEACRLWDRLLEAGAATA
jgi:aminomethyltransferase